MIIIVSWHPDESGEPDVVGIPEGDGLIEALFTTVRDFGGTPKSFRVFRVQAVDKPLAEIFWPQDQSR